MGRSPPRAFCQEEAERKAILIWDNCGPTFVPLKETFASINVECHNFPSNMTDWLHVMDLVVNELLKRGIRSQRCDEFFEYFHQFNARRLGHLLRPAAECKFDSWQPPNPKLADGICTVLEVESSVLSSKKFQSSMFKCSIAVGSAPNEYDESVQYKDVKRGTLISLHHDVSKLELEEMQVFDPFNVGDVTVPLEMVRPPASEEVREADEDGFQFICDDEDNEEVDDEEEFHRIMLPHLCIQSDCTTYLPLN